MKQYRQFMVCADKWKRFQVSGFRCQLSRWPKSVQSDQRSENRKHRTSNIERRI